jgi:hypothetical protein
LQDRPLGAADRVVQHGLVFGKRNPGHCVHRRLPELWPAVWLTVGSREPVHVRRCVYC